MKVRSSAASTRRCLMAAQASTPRTTRERGLLVAACVSITLLGTVPATPVSACPDGSYAVDGAPLFPGDPGGSRVIVIDGTSIAIGSPALEAGGPGLRATSCDPARVRLRRTAKGGFRVRASWRACGGVERVRFRALIEADRTMSGVIRGRKFKRPFVAHPCADAASCAKPCTDNDDCAETQWCAKTKGDCEGEGVCTEIPGAICLALFEPVCGCDGFTYGNECLTPFERVNVRHDGRCDDACASSEECPAGSLCILPEGNCTPPDGTYDVMLTSRSSVRSGAVALVETVGDDFDIRIELDTFDSILLHATPQPDGSFGLQGYRIQGFDAYVGTSGTGTVELVGGTRRITATLSDYFTTLDLVLERPLEGMPIPWSGPYDFAFDPSPSGCECSSVATLALAVAPDGTATLTGGVDGHGDALGTFTVGSCIVSPFGQVDCVGHYEPRDEDDGWITSHIVLHGTLAKYGALGAGRYLRGLPPSLFRTGSWSARTGDGQ